MNSIISPHRITPRYSASNHEYRQRAPDGSPQPQIIQSADDQDRRRKDVSVLRPSPEGLQAWRDSGHALGSRLPRYDSIFVECQAHSLTDLKPYAPELCTFDFLRLDLCVGGLLVLMFTGLSGYIWRYQIGPWVRRGFRVVAPNMLGYGETVSMKGSDEEIGRPALFTYAPLLRISPQTSPCTRHSPLQPIWRVSSTLWTSRSPWSSSRTIGVRRTRGPSRRGTRRGPG